MSERSLREIAKKFPPQFGQSLDVDGVTGSAFATIAKDVVRWQGETEDVRAWRVYLSPWQPKSNIAVVTNSANAPWATATPWNTPPGSFDSFVTAPVFARVMFGSAGVVHTAYVDWPTRGCLIQVSCNYLQVDGVGNLSASQATRLPVLAGTLAPEPGGGDAGNPATFSYRRQVAGVRVTEGDPYSAWYFQVPPFARAWTLLASMPQLTAAGASLVTVYNQSAQNAIGVGADQVWQYNASVGDRFPDSDAIPLCQWDQTLIVVVDAAPVSEADLLVGMMFHLDL